VQCTVTFMERPSRFEHFRFIGDKRSQVVHDLDRCSDAAVMDELMAAETYLCFGPDTLAEARNRGYRACKSCAGVGA
jgi:hypothetical protein